ncbi:cobalt-precorrin 5A hydrolase [Acetobacterium wieringae]|uniref:cobalt-precorrin 5A hydrolase n=1 Tax=Acetobacterium wieringae TaxID=52694 RepID=UPI0026EF1F47|nr:cobalt-precorrin 5A hydrolase [Acetobacterium wieringae]
MKTEKWAIVTLSKDGMVLANRLAKHLDDRECQIYTKEKYANETTNIIPTDIATFMGSIIGEYQIICCIMATGIVVRAIAPHLAHKSSDPGILVMDTNGEFVISLLSGHLGGANDAARLVAKRLAAQAVITTGTDVKGTMAVDVLAQKINCTIDNFTDAKDVTALILNGDPIALINQENCDLDAVVLPRNIETVADLSATAQYAGAIITTLNREKSDLPIPSVKLVPKKLVLGVGCRRDTPGERIIQAIIETLAALNLSEKGIKSLATIGLKADEPGIIEACTFFTAKKVIIPNEMVQMVQSRFEASDFVFKTTGLYAVSEPCGFVASGFGKCLLEKQKLGGITLSVWQDEN